ncbi:MAG: hypothetical protein LBL82_04290 [Oscillospiraceae bacterium]|nr:hypothetical protein [Oscillospiraceae bacterium]
MSITARRFFMGFGFTIIVFMFIFGIIVVKIHEQNFIIGSTSLLDMIKLSEIDREIVASILNVGERMLEFISLQTKWIADLYLVLCGLVADLFSFLF